MGHPPMASRDETLAALRAAFATLSSADEAEVVEGDDDGIDVIGEEWTFHAEGWPGPAIAWLALDDEPDEENDRSIREACEAALPPEAFAALAAADQQLNGALRASLVATLDPVSRDLARAITAMIESEG